MVCMHLWLYFRFSFMNFLETCNLYLFLLFSHWNGLSNSFFLLLTLHFLITLLTSPLLFFWFSLDFSKPLLIVAVKALMVEVAFYVVLPYFMKIVHVELHDDRNYLSYKWGIVAVLEVFGQNLAWKKILVDHDEAYAARSPSNCVAVFLLLSKGKAYVK